MFEHFYYTSGNYHICYHKQGSFQCINYGEDKNIHMNVNRGSWTTGDHIYKNEEISRVKIDNHTTEVVKKTTIIKVHKGMKEPCPYCGGKIIFNGWRVWVENIKNEKVVAGMFSTGTKTVYSKQCKTLKNRRETINRLLKKYK